MARFNIYLGSTPITLSLHITQEVKLTIMITIQELVQREVIYCVSSLIHTLTQENKLDEELAFSRLCRKE